jgi:hypothetical protein
LENNGDVSVNKTAMYVHMSTDHQKDSPENQADAIRKYAARYNIEIIQISFLLFYVEL